MKGTVSLVQYLSGYGNTVIINVGDKDFLFAHLARPSTLRPGEHIMVRLLVRLVILVVRLVNTYTLK